MKMYLTVKGARPFVEELKGGRAPLTASNSNVKYHEVIMNPVEVFSKWYYNSFFPLEKSVKNYVKHENKNYSNYNQNLTNDNWNNFSKKLKQIYKNAKFPDTFVFDEINLKEIFDNVIENEQKNFFPITIDGLTLNTINIENYAGELPAKGVMKVKYTSESGPSMSLFTVTPAMISFCQTPSGGLIISLTQQQAEGLFKNTPERIIYKYFRRIETVTELDIIKSLDFFLLCASERSLWGQPTFWGKLKYKWIVKYKSAFWEILLSKFDKIILTAIKLNK